MGKGIAWSDGVRARRNILRSSLSVQVWCPFRHRPGDGGHRPAAARQRSLPASTATARMPDTRRFAARRPTVATANRSAYQIEIQCPDVASELRLERGIIHERLGTLFEMDLSLYSDDQIALADVIGKGLAVAVTTASEERFFHGVVTHFAYVGQTDRHAHYHAVLRPKLWLLGQSARCRVFKSMTAADILKQLLGDTIDLGGVASSPSVKFEHCVQYRETDLHFVSRLMERYGFYYFHQHSRSKHTLEIVSGLSGHRS